MIRLEASVDVGLYHYTPVLQDRLLGRIQIVGGDTTLLLDMPRGYALKRLWQTDGSLRRAKTVVVTDNPDRVYRDVLLARGPAAVVDLDADAITAAVKGRRVEGVTQDRQILTWMEAQTVGLALLGMSTAELGERLRITTKTVNAHISSAIRKAGASSRSELFGMMMMGAAPS